MTPQLSLTYRPAHVGAEAWKQQLEMLRAAVSHLGHKDVAYELDVAGSLLSDALAERDRKRWAAEWTLVVLAMLESRRDEVADDLARRILETPTALSPFVLEERKELTAEELAIAYERELRSMGKAGESAIARATRRQR